MEIESDQPQPPSATTSNAITPKGQLSWKEKWLEEMRGNLSLVAALIASITFQAALNPPGGVVQTSTHANTTIVGCTNLITPAGATLANTTICTGEAVFAVLNSTVPFYRYFLRGSIFSFVSSLSVALLLVSGIPLRHRLPIWFLSITMSASLTSLAFTFVCGVIMLSPHPIYSEEDKNFTIVMGTWIGLLLLVMLFNTIRFLGWLVQTCHGTGFRVLGFKD